MSILKQLAAKQKRIEALEQAARAAHSQHKTDLAEHQQRVSRLQHQLATLQTHSQAPQAASSHRSPAVLQLKKPLLLQRQAQGHGQLSGTSFQEVGYEGQVQLAAQAEQVARLQQEATVADRQLEKLSNLLEAQKAHAGRLEVQLDSKADAAKSRFAKVSLPLLSGLGGSGGEGVTVCTIC